MRIYIDIDGTLTTDGSHAHGPVRHRAIDRTRELIAAEHEVFIWSGRGSMYAMEFSHKNNLFLAAGYLGKPDIYIDDHKEMRDPGHMRYIDPDTFEQAATVEALLAGDDE